MFTGRSLLAFASVLSVTVFYLQNGWPGYALLWFLLAHRILMQFP